MRIAIDVTESISVVKSNVRFIASFFSQKDTFSKAFDSVFTDMKTLTDILSKLDVPNDSVKTTPVQANANWVRVKKELAIRKNIPDKSKSYEMVQKGFVASGNIIIELPLDWADNNHKFSSIYTSVDGLKTKSRMTYDFYADNVDIKNANITLRGKLLDAAKTKLNEIMANQPSISFKLSRVVYGASHNSYPNVLRSCKQLDNSSYSDVIKEEPTFDADTIDNMISLNFAPEFELTDSIKTEWKSVKK